MGIQVSSLKGMELDYWVAKASGMPVYQYLADDWPGSSHVIYEGSMRPVIDIDQDGVVRLRAPGFFGPFRPSTDWSQGGPIIERERLEILRDFCAPFFGGPWGASHPRDNYESMQPGSTALEAAMRALVDSRFGEEVVPDDERIYARYCSNPLWRMGHGNV